MTAFRWPAAVSVRNIEIMTAVRVAPELARPGRHALVALDLGELQGPVDGTVTLPLQLWWSGASSDFDLDEPGILEMVYRTVLREAACPDDLSQFLNGDKLVEVWPSLWLPRGVRRAWEDSHPALAQSGVAADAN